MADPIIIMNKLKSIATSAVVTALTVLPNVALAATANPFNEAKNLTGSIGKEAGLGEAKPLELIIGNIINVALGFLGVVLLGYLLYAGFLWMTAGGDKGQVDKAKMMIQQAIIGLIVITAAFAISSFVLGSLVNATQNGGV